MQLLGLDVLNPLKGYPRFVSTIVATYTYQWIISYSLQILFLNAVYSHSASF